MPKYKIMIGRPVSTGVHRHEVGSFLSHIAEKVRDPRSDVQPFIEEWYSVPVQSFPTSVARNQLVAAAKKYHVDFLFMVDDDAAPCFEFFEHAFHFLRQQPVPSIIASPYVSGDGDVQIFEFSTQQHTQQPLDTWALTRIARGDAFRRKSTERVGSVGTHLVAYDVRVFDAIKPPYYQYGYNDDHTTVTETEDCFCHRQLFNAKVPIYVAWDHWSGHWKPQLLSAPMPLPLEMIPEFWLQKAKEYLMYQEKKWQQERV